MEKYLRELNRVLGVVGAFVCLPDGSLAANAMSDKFDTASVEAAARLAAQTLSALEVSRQRVVDADLVYGQGRLIVKNLRGGILVIMCARNINIPLLNLTANAVAKEIAPKLRPPKAVSAASAPPLTAAKAIAPPTPGTAETPAPMLEAASRHIAPPTDPVDSRFFDELTRELNRIIGPAGSVIVEEEVAALKETREGFPKARTAELVERVSLVLRDDAERAKFKQVMLQAIRKL